MTTIPSLPFSGQQLRETLVALDEAIDGKESSGTAATAVAAHAAAADPHPGYLTQDKGDARYAALGSTGGGLAAYVHTQSTPATTWTINHNLGRYPSVELFNSGMQEIDAEIAHPSVNQTLVTLNPATAGLARLI
jgi:hypothetical protein